MRAKTLRGLPVIRVEDGSMVGRVQDYIIDPAGEKVEGLVVSEKSYLKGRSHPVPFSRIQSIGQDAVIVKGGEELEDEEHPGLEQSQSYSLLGKSIISNDGNYIAKVLDFVFSAATGEIESLIITNTVGREKTGLETFLAKEAIVNMGKDYIIADHNYSSYITEKTGEKEKTDGAAKTKETFQTFEARAVDFALHKEAARNVRDPEGNIIVEKGEIITPEIIESARAAGKLNQVLFAAGIGELLDNIDQTVEILDQGGQRLLEAWETFKKKSQQLFRTTPLRQKGKATAETEMEEDEEPDEGHEEILEVEIEEPGEEKTTPLVDDIDVFDRLKEIYTQIKQEIATEGQMLGQESMKRMKMYIEGKKANYTIRDSQGQILVEREQKITRETIEKAEVLNMIPNLFFAVITQEIEVNLRLIGEKLSDTFR
jgi:sporulation protein YlmC with PRC-barrel domain